MARRAPFVLIVSRRSAAPDAPITSAITTSLVRLLGLNAPRRGSDVLDLLKRKGLRIITVPTRPGSARVLAVVDEVVGMKPAKVIVVGRGLFRTFGEPFGHTDMEPELLPPRARAVAPSRSFALATRSGRGAVRRAPRIGAGAALAAGPAVDPKHPHLRYLVQPKSLELLGPALDRPARPQRIQISPATVLDHGAAAARRGNRQPASSKRGRFVDVVFRRMDETGLATDVPPGDALVLNADYQVEVYVRQQRKGIALEGEEREILDPRQGAPITLQVCIEGAGFEIPSQIAQLILPPKGDTDKGARFRVRPIAVTPSRAVPATLRIRLYWEFNLVDQVMVRAEVVDDDTAQSPWRTKHPLTLRYLGTLAGKVDVKNVYPRHLAISVDRHDDVHGFGFAFRNEVDATIKYEARGTGIETEMLDDRLTAIRGELWQVGQADVYAGSIDGGPAYEDHLRRLAIEGRRLWSFLFERKRNSDLWAVGEYLRQRPLPAGSTIQVTVGDSASSFVFPWTLLYDGVEPEQASAEDLFEGFWGSRYVVEQLAPGTTADDDVAAVDSLKVSYFFWPFHPFYEEHEPEVRKLATAISGSFDAHSPISASAVAEALLKSCDSRFVYFYSHGYTERSPGSGIPDFLTLYGKMPPAEQEIWKQEYKRLAKPDQRRSRIELNTGSIFLDVLTRAGNLDLTNHPIVFLNMCESAQIAPSLSSSFIQLFLDRGAQTVIGTECAIRPNLGRAFAAELFLGLAKGDPVGDVLLATRRTLGKTQRNPLALAYTLYGSCQSRLPA